MRMETNVCMYFSLLGQMIRGTSDIHIIKSSTFLYASRHEHRDSFHPKQTGDKRQDDLKLESHTLLWLVMT